MNSNFTKSLENKNRISHYIALHDPSFSILHCVVFHVAFFFTPLLFISEGIIFLVCYLLLYYSHYLIFTVLGEGGEFFYQI